VSINFEFKQMGEIKDLGGYYISEVDLIENYMILKKKQGA